MGGTRSTRGKDRIGTKKAKQQLSARQAAFRESEIGRIPGMSMLMGNISLAAQQKALDEGGTAIAVPGTRFAAQGQRYSEEAGQTPEKFQSRISATKPARGSGEGYVGDVAGVVSEGKFLGMDTKTFTGRTGFTPSGEKIDEPRGGGGATKLAEAPPTEPEIVPEVTPEIIPDDTVLSSKTRRTRSKRSGAGGTLIEGYGVLTA